MFEVGDVVRFRYTNEYGDSIGKIISICTYMGEDADEVGEFMYVVRFNSEDIVSFHCNGFEEDFKKL